MKSYYIEQFGSIAGISLREHAIPEPKAKQVLIKIKAASLNRRDLYILNQIYPLPPRAGVVPLSDGVGEVISTGSDVTRFKPGDRVAGNYFANWRSGQVGWDIADQFGCTLDGMLCEYAVLEEHQVVHIPSTLSWIEAATLPCAALTAWSSLTFEESILPGDTILTIGSGGVPLFAIQFANMLGAQVIALTSKDSKIEPLRKAGARHVINYHANKEWSAEVLKITNGKGINRIIESGGTDTFEQSLKAAAFGGQVILVSSIGSVNNGAQSSLLEMLNTIFVQLITVRPLFVGNRISFEKMNAAIEHHKLKPVIDKVFTFSEALKAYEYFAQGDVFGKVVIAME